MVVKQHSTDIFWHSCIEDHELHSQNNLISRLNSILQTGQI